MSIAPEPPARARPLSRSRFLGVTELAEVIGTTRDKVYGMVAAGTLPPCWMRVGRAQRWQRAHVAAWLETGEWPRAAWREER